MKLGDKVRASFPYGGVPACEGEIVKEVILARDVVQYCVSFQVRPNVYKTFNLTARELTLCPSVAQKDTNDSVSNREII